eukprot:g6401.t1
MSAIVSNTPSVIATIVSTKKTFKLTNINVLDTFEQLKEVIISHLYSKTLMKTKYLRIIINGKQIENTKLQISTLNVKNKTKMKLKVNVLFTEEFHLKSEKEKKKMLEKKDADMKINASLGSNIMRNNNDINDLKPENKTKVAYFIQCGPNDVSSSSVLSVLVIHGTTQYTIHVNEGVTLLLLKIKLKDILELNSTKRLKLIAKGKVLTDDNIVLSSLSNSNNKKRVKMRLLHDETYYRHEEGGSVLDNVLKSLNETKKNVHSLYSQLAHNFYDKAKITLQRGSYDFQLENLKRNLQSIKIKEEDRSKLENALSDLEKVYEENEKINQLLSKRN